MTVDFKPKKPLTVAVLRADGTPAKPRHRGDRDLVRAIVCDKDGNVLQALEWSVDYIERQIEMAKSRGHDAEQCAQGLLGLGEDAKTAVWQEIMAALTRRAKEKT